MTEAKLLAGVVIGAVALFVVFAIVTIWNGKASAAPDPASERWCLEPEPVWVSGRSLYSRPIQGRGTLYILSRGSNGVAMCFVPDPSLEEGR